MKVILIFATIIFLFSAKTCITSDYTNEYDFYQACFSEYTTESQFHFVIDQDYQINLEGLRDQVLFVIPIYAFHEIILEIKTPNIENLEVLFDELKLVDQIKKFDMLWDIEYDQLVNFNGLKQFIDKQSINFKQYSFDFTYKNNSLPDIGALFKCSHCKAKFIFRFEDYHQLNFDNTQKIDIEEIFSQIKEPLGIEIQILNSPYDIQNVYINFFKHIKIYNKLETMKVTVDRVTNIQHILAHIQEINITGLDLAILDSKQLNLKSTDLQVNMWKDNLEWFILQMNNCQILTMDPFYQLQNYYTNIVAFKLNLSNNNIKIIDVQKLQTFNSKIKWNWYIFDNNPVTDLYLNQISVNIDLDFLTISCTNCKIEDLYLTNMLANTTIEQFNLILTGGSFKEFPLHNMVGNNVYLLFCQIVVLNENLESFGSTRQRNLPTMTNKASYISKSNMILSFYDIPENEKRMNLDEIPVFFDEQIMEVQQKPIDETLKYNFALQIYNSTEWITSNMAHFYQIEMYQGQSDNQQILVKEQNEIEILEHPYGYDRDNIICSVTEGGDYCITCDNDECIQCQYGHHIGESVKECYSYLSQEQLKECDTILKKVNNNEPEFSVNARWDQTTEKYIIEQYIVTEVEEGICLSHMIIMGDYLLDLTPKDKGYIATFELQNDFQLFGCSIVTNENNINLSCNSVYEQSIRGTLKKTIINFQINYDIEPINYGLVNVSVDKTNNFVPGQSYYEIPIHEEICFGDKCQNQNNKDIEGIVGEILKIKIKLLMFQESMSIDVKDLKKNGELLSPNIFSYQFDKETSLLVINIDTNNSHFSIDTQVTISYTLTFNKIDTQQQSRRVLLNSSKQQPKQQVDKTKTIRMSPKNENAHKTKDNNNDQLFQIIIMFALVWIISIFIISGIYLHCKFQKKLKLKNNKYKDGTNNNNDTKKMNIENIGQNTIINKQIQQITEQQSNNAEQQLQTESNLVQNKNGT